MSDATEPKVFEIPAENMPGLLHKLDGLSKKSKKLLGKPIDLNVLREHRKPHLVTNRMTGKLVQAVDADGNLCWNLFYDVTINAETPKIHGWSFIATIDHSPAAGNIIRTSPNANCEVPSKYRTGEPMCDYCKKARHRRDTFLLRCDATGDFKQIGRQCIRDFIGHDVTQVVAMAEIISHAQPSDSDSDGDWSGGMGDRRYIMVKTYLAHVAAIIRTNGWISKKDSEFGRGIATAGHAHTNMFPPPKSARSNYDRVPITDKDIETADAALAYGQALVVRSDFDNNLKVVASEFMVEHRSIGILAYLIPAFFRASQREFERVQRRAALKLGESQFVGAVGHKIGTGKKHQIAPFEAVLYGYHVMSGYYGPTHIYRFRADDGNVFIWFASEGPAEALDLGGIDATKRVKVRIEGGSVKKHTEHDGVKQTYLTRCKVVVLEAAAAA